MNSNCIKMGDTLKVILVPLEMNAECMKSIPSSTQKYNIGPKKRVEHKKETYLANKTVTRQVGRNNKKTKNSNEDPQSTLKNEETENLQFKQPHNKLAPSKVDNNENKSNNKQLKVILQVLVEKGKANHIHNLRKLQPKNYVEESVLENSSAPTEVFTATDPNKKNLPVYKRTLPEEPKDKPKIADLYEFTDFSPKAKKLMKSHRQHRSSILFDKDIHEVMKKLEENEAKTQKKVARTRKKLEKKKYDRIIEKIMSNVKQKISKNDGFSKDLICPAHNQTKNVNLVRNKNEIFEKANHGKVTHISNFEDINIIVHNSSEVPSNVENPGTTPGSIPQNPRTATTSNLRASYTEESNNDDFLDTSHRDSIPLQSIGSCDNSVIQNVDNCFGFDDDIELNTPIKLVQKNTPNIISNILLKSAVSNIESPQDFIPKPNANSTMICGPNSCISSPWRADWVKIKRNPHFLSLKNNALPRIDQEMVLDHTLVENYESACKTSFKDTPAKKQPVQQSILDYVSTNIEKENMTHGSLYDYEEFISPEKQVKARDRDKVKEVKRNILGDEDCIISSTPIRRRALTDISNFSGELKDPNSQNLTYFGFNESIQNDSNKTPEKYRKNIQNRPEDDKENDSAKPFRFDVNKLRNYSKKTRNTRNKATAEVQTSVFEDQNKSNSLFEMSSEEHSGEIHLFEEPEEMLDNMSAPHLDDARPRRKRLDSCDSDASECGRKRKRHRKTKLELEQEAWIRDFNKMCEEVENHELELE